MRNSFDQVIGAIYDAAVEPGQWPAALEQIAGSIGALAGFVAGLDVRQGRGAYWHAIGHTPATQAVYNERYLPLDPTLEHIVRAPGRAHACSDYLSEAEVAASPFFQEFLLPLGIRYVLSGVTRAQGSRVNFFGFQRGAGQAPFGAAETDFMQRLMPHLARADDIANKVSSISDAKRMALALLDRIDYGILLVDRLGQICLSNQSAERWLEAGQVLTALFGRVRLAAGQDNETLGKALQAVIEGGCESHTVTARGARLVLLPVEAGSCAAIVIADEHQRRSLAPQLLKTSYGLTPAEIRVALGLADGHTQEELSGQLSVSLSTIKTHTQRIFQKTGVARQVDLLRLIFGLPALSLAGLHGAAT